MSKPNSHINNEVINRTNYFIKKDNEVTKALFYDLSLTAYRIILLAGSDKFLSQLNQPNNKDKRIRISATEYHDVFGKPDAHISPSYRVMKKSVTELLNAKLRFKNFKNDTDEGKWNGGVNWISYAAYNDTLKVLELSFSPDILPFMHQVSTRYTYYNLRNISELSSMHSVRMYELMMFWRKKGQTPIISVPLLKTWLGIPDDDYADDVKRFSYQVVKKSIIEINEKNTGIELELYTQKHNKITTGYSISVAQSTLPEPTDEEEPEDTRPEPEELDEDGLPVLKF